MGIKNPHIKHITYWEDVGPFPGLRYICQTASSVTREKIALKDEEVTCKNCIIKMHGTSDKRLIR